MKVLRDKPSIRIFKNVPPMARPQCFLFSFKHTEVPVKPESHEASMSEAIQSALNCVRACEMCAIACLQEKEVDMLRECIRLNMDCAAICELSAKFMIRESRFHVDICRLCADICQACAEECDRHQHMSHCKECSKTCRECAEACRTMIGAMA